MGKKSRKDRDYPILGSALKSLRHSEFALFYGMFGRLQIGWNVFCSRDDWNTFHTWMRPHIDKLYARKISYQKFRDELADYIERLSNPNTHGQLLMLVRETFNCKDEKELYKRAKEIFKIGDARPWEK